MDLLLILNSKLVKIKFLWLEKNSKSTTMIDVGSLWPSKEDRNPDLHLQTLSI